MEVTTFNAVPRRVMMAIDGLLNPTYSIVVIKSRCWFLILRGKFDSKMLDLIVYNSKTILKIIAHFDSFLAGNHVQIHGEYGTTAYSRDKIAYPNHSVKLHGLKCQDCVYQVETSADPADNLLYDVLVAQKIYQNWTDRSIRAAKVSHKDFYNKYKKLHLDFCKYPYFSFIHLLTLLLDSEPDAPADPPPVVVLDNNLSEKTARRRQLKSAVGEFKDVFELEGSVAQLKKGPLSKQSKLDSKINIPRPKK